MQRLTVLQVDGTAARPRGADALQAAYNWIDDLDPETAQEYHSAAEIPEGRGTSAETGGCNYWRPRAGHGGGGRDDTPAPRRMRLSSTKGAG